MGNEVIGIEAGDSGPGPHFVFREFTYPAPLTDDEHERITDVSLSCLQALGLGCQVALRPWPSSRLRLRSTSAIYAAGRMLTIGLRHGCRSFNHQHCLPASPAHVGTVW